MWMGKQEERLEAGGCRLEGLTCPTDGWYDGTSWTNAYRYLQDALSVSQGGDDEIRWGLFESPWANRVCQSATRDLALCGVGDREGRIVNGQTRRPVIEASNARVDPTTPWTSQAYFLPRLASVMWPSR